MISQEVLIEKFNKMRALEKYFTSVLVGITTTHNSHIGCLSSQIEREDDAIKFNGYIDATFDPFWAEGEDFFYINREQIYDITVFSNIKDKKVPGLIVRTNGRYFAQIDLVNAVATFNADPYCVENEEQAAEIMSEIKEHGAIAVTDGEDREIALAKLDLPSDSTRVVYRAGGCLFSVVE